jgi:CspA family cold shock protein
MAFVRPLSWRPPSFQPHTQRLREERPQLSQSRGRRSRFREGLGAENPEDRVSLPQLCEALRTREWRNAGRGRRLARRCLNQRRLFRAGGTLASPFFRQISVTILTCLRKGRTNVATGTVKWFNSTKGYGFIQPDGGGKDVFVHISAVEKAGFSSLAEGAKISYEIISDRGKESAGNLRL